MFKTLKAEKNYRKLFFAGIVNGIGDRFSQVALLTLILEITGSGMAVGITMGLRMVPFLLFGPFSSRLANKWTRRKLLITTDFIRAIIAISFLFIDSADDMWIVYTGSFLLSSGEALYGPVRKAGIPAIVLPARIKDVNSWEQVSLGFVLIIGALSGGIVSFLFGPNAAFLINIFSFVSAGLMIKSIPNLESKDVHTSSQETSKISGIFSLSLASSFLLMLVTFDLLNPLINGIENILLSVYAVKVFHMGGLGVGILYSVLGTGLIVSPILSSKIRGHYLPFAFLCLLMEGVVLSSISQVHSFTLVAILFGVLTVFSGVGNTLMDTAVMQIIPSWLHGTYFAFSATAGNTSIGISMFMTGILLEDVSPRMMGLTGGLLYICLGGAYFLWATRINIQREQQIIRKGKIEA